MCLRRFAQGSLAEISTWMPTRDICRPPSKTEKFSFSGKWSFLVGRDSAAFRKAQTEIYTEYMRDRESNGPHVSV